MAQVKLGDVAVESRETYKGDKTGMPIVGLEHITPGEVTLSNWDTDTDNTFTKRFRKGDMLFGRRRAYLKKAAQAPFDGICSGDITVIRAKEDLLLPELLPFVIQNDNLFDFAVGKSAGSLSPRVKWDNLKNYTVELPPMEEQRKLAEVLWSINDTLQAYQKLLTETDALVQAQFVEMFGDPVVNEKSYPLKKIEEIASTRLGKMLDSKRQSGLHQFPYLANANVQWFHFDLNNLNQMDFNDKDRVEFSLRDGDLLVCEGGEVGRCAIWRNNMRDCFFQKAIHRVRCNEKIIIPEYLAYNFLYHSKQNGFSDIVGTRSTIAHLPGDKLRNMKIVLPPLNLQYEFKNYSEQAEKSKSALLNTITSLQATKRCILENALRTGRKE